jgi:hypothetical protein
MQSGGSERNVSILKEVTKVSRGSSLFFYQQGIIYHQQVPKVFKVPGVPRVSRGSSSFFD